MTWNPFRRCRAVAPKSLHVPSEWIGRYVLVSSVDEVLDGARRITGKLIGLHASGTVTIYTLGNIMAFNPERIAMVTLLKDQDGTHMEFQWHSGQERNG